MSHSTKKQHHEQARKKHKQEQLEHARELAKKKPSTTAAWVLGIGLAVMLTFVLAVTLF
ncbi:MAG: hypothetical protein K8U57_23365 [Planctomycetes bacterium]|nr:hypothetical protein [Planctomycetota bacterium]